jgi:Ni/Fe-hydrogenase subunit HybB-like protein
MVAGYSVLSRLGPAFYEKLNDRTGRFLALARARLKKRGIDFALPSAGSMFTVFLGRNKVENFADAKRCDTAKFARFFHAMQKNGVYIPPSLFEAYFVSGAFLVGAGGVVVAMYIFRKSYNLEKYITVLHFEKMGRIVILLALLYLYFNVNEYLVPAFKMKKPEEQHLTQLFAGEFAPVFWFAILIGMIIPIFILIFKKGRKPLPMFIAGIMIVVGAWFKRYLIVTPTLLHPFLPMNDVPESYKHYFPSWQEWAIAMGSLAGALLIITFFARVYPVIPIQETINEQNEKAEQL